MSFFNGKQDYLKINLLSQEKNAVCRVRSNRLLCIEI